MTREELNELTVEEVGKKLQEALDAFKVQVSEINDETIIKQMEEDLMKEMKDFEEYLKGTKYDLPDNVTYDGAFYTKKDIADKVVTFINKNEVEFQYVLGLQQLSKLWRNVSNLKNIDYYKYDSTLRVLGQLRYKGYKEWTDILAINNYFSNCHEQYTKDTTFNIYLSQKHNAIMDRMQLMTGIDPATGTEVKENCNCENCDKETCECEKQSKRSKKNA